MRQKKNTGFTLVELMGVVAIIGVLALLAAPSFKDTMQQQRVEGASEAYAAALQNARAEAIKRNSTMGIVFTPASTGTTHSTWCFGMSNGVCDCTAANSCLPGSVVKSSDYVGVMVNFNTSRSRIFSPLRGTVTQGTVTFSGGSNKTLNVVTSTIGRVRVCKPTGTAISNYKDC